MRVLQVIHRYRPRIGGLENYVYNLRICLSEMGHQVDVLTTDYKLPKLAEKEPYANYCKTIVAPMDNPFSLDLIKELQTRTDYDIYHLHGSQFLDTWIASKIFPQNKTVLTAHVAKIEGYGLSYQLAHNIFKPIMAYVLKRCKFIICLTETDKQTISNEFKISCSKIKVIPNGIPANLTQLCSYDENELCRVLGLIPESFKILYVGRIQPVKNVDFLISVADMLPDDIEVIIAGPSERVDYIRTLRRLIARVHHPVHVFLDMPFDVLTCLYKYSDIFVTLGEVEGLPTTILEAMAFGLPIVCYRVGGLSELFTKGGGIVIDQLNKKILFDAILSFYTDKSFRKRASEVNLSNIKHYQWPMLAKRIEKVYHEITNR